MSSVGVAATNAEVGRQTIVDEFISTMKWHPDTPADVRGLVEGNLRGFWGWLGTLPVSKAAHDSYATVVAGLVDTATASDLRFEPLLQFFAYAHLPAHLQTISAPFAELAEGMMAHLPANPQRTAMLGKLLEAKDCAVRAALYR